MVGRNHSQFQLGDEVFGEIWDYHGGFAEYVCTRGRAWALKQTNPTFVRVVAILQAGVIARAVKQANVEYLPSDKHGMVWSSTP